MVEISNLEEWIKDYFSSPVNQKKSEKACERYDRLMVKNIRRQLSMGVEQIHVIGDEVDDPGKVLEKAKYEILPSSRSIIRSKSLIELIFCETIITVGLFSRLSRFLRNCLSVPASKAEVESSKITTPGLPARVLAILNLCFWPPDNPVPKAKTL